MADPQPGRLPLGHQGNFTTLLRAALNGDLALVSAIRQSDHAQVSLVCAMQVDRDEDTVEPIPIAVMIDGNPYEQFFDPTQLVEKEESDGKDAGTVGPGEGAVG